MDKPIRLTFKGEVESYSAISGEWHLDKSRDPREFIPLTMTPAATESLTALKPTCVNAIAHSLRQFFTEQKSNLSDLTPDTPDATAVLESNWLNVYYNALYTLGIKANSFNAYTTEAVFWYGFVYLLSSQFALADLNTIMDSTWWDKVVCHMWCHMSDDCTFTYNNWLSLVQAIRDDTTLGDAQEWLRLACILVGRKGLTNLGYLKVNDNDISDPGTDCDCG
jgi:hypothetical protein